MCTDLKNFITKGLAHFVTHAVKAVSAVRQVVVTVTGIRKEYASCRIVFCHGSVNGERRWLIAAEQNTMQLLSTQLCIAQLCRQQLLEFYLYFSK